jgi:lactose/L-arabinose transport system ATP-binding protein
MTAIELKNVRKSFGATSVVHGIDLAIEQGEFVVFVGPSGCGKSTLLRMIAGLEDVTSGTIEIDGVVVNDVEPSARKLAMVFQSYALYPHMSVAGNMSFGLRMTGTPRDETDRRVAEAARILQLESLMGRKPAQLSGGQRQRVAIGRAIVRQPRAFLFDEPLSNLDAELRAQMRVEVAKLHHDLAATMIYVTHDQVEAMTLADRIVVLRAGRVEQVGTPAELYGDPANVFVAGFMGSPRMNLLPAKVDSSGAISLEAAQWRPALNHPLEPGASVILGLRPESLDNMASDAVRFPIKVDIVENLGSTSIAHGRLASGAQILVEQRGAIRARAGESVDAKFHPSDALIFAEDGQRIR